jgi:hypothetical protein
MATITKYRCDHCHKEVADTYLENGWLKFAGGISRSWGTRERAGNVSHDFIEKGCEFCSIACLVAHLDAIREKARGPKIDTPPLVVADPFKSEAARKAPWEDPLPEDELALSEEDELALKKLDQIERP